jgi:hypothetical protein
MRVVRDYPHLSLIFLSIFLAILSSLPGEFGIISRYPCTLEILIFHNSVEKDSARG